MIGLAEGKWGYKLYNLSKTDRAQKDDDENADINGLYAECNGDVCYNACKCVTITDKTIVFEVEDSIISANIESVKLNERFMKYCKEIFGELLKHS